MKNQVLFFPCQTIIPIKSILRIRGDPTAHSIEVLYGNNNETYLVKCTSSATYAAAMEYVTEASNNKRDASDHQWPDWAAAVTSHDEEEEEEEIIRVEEKQSVRTTKSPFPKYMELGKSVAAKMTSGNWEIVVVTNLNVQDSIPTITVQSQDSGTVRIRHDDPIVVFQEIREDLNMDRSVKDCISWLNQPVLYLPERNSYLLHHGHVRGAAISGPDYRGEERLSIQPSHPMARQQCLEVPINRVYALMW